MFTAAAARDVSVELSSASIHAEVTGYYWERRMSDQGRGTKDRHTHTSGAQAASRKGKTIRSKEGGWTAS